MWLLAFSAWLGGFLPWANHGRRGPPPELVVPYTGRMACYALILEVARNHPALVGTAVVLLSGIVGHFPVIWFLKLTDFLRTPDPGKPNFGRWIGIFERFAITLFVFLDALGGAVFIFGLKTAVMSWRVEKDDNKKDIVEYILIGTFVSFIVAVAFGLVGRGLLGLPVVKPHS